ncbi:MAG: tRNA (adenosine(37)-N6)-dimethylallyltransferase MiaA, partial [Rikenellaceae bacterium]|nr:tRNA (adenosine(37)-N6)-dimethylallyltransferase MiaA [Rikenellaceae bacterium]
VVVGATATGKTDLSIGLARRFDAPVVSCDSRQMYREMPIGTAAPSAEEQVGIPHYFIASRSVTEPYTSGRFELEALALLDRLFRKHDVVVMVGGSGLYADAVCRGIDAVPGTNPELRQAVTERLEREGLDALYAELRRHDPEYAAVVDRSNPQRIVRALEVCLETGKTYSELRGGQAKARPFRIVKIGVAMPRAALYERIDRRVDAMVAAGLEAEARRLLPLRELNALQTVGYREFFDFFDGTIFRDEAIELIKRNSRRYAKRQITWFARDPEITWFERNKTDFADVDEIERHIRLQLAPTTHEPSER